MVEAKKKTSFKEKFVEVWGKVANNPSFTLKETLGYSCGIFGNSATQDVEAYALTLFLTNFMGISAAYVLILNLVAKIANIIVDPIAGIVMDRRTKQGRSLTKIFALVSPFPLAVSSILLFVVPDIAPMQRVIYVFIFYLIYCIADSFYDMSLNTISSRMTTNSNDRKNFYTVATFASTLGGMLPSGLIPIFVSLYKESEQYIYLYFSIVFAVIGFFMMIVPAFTLKEKTNFKYIKKTTVDMNFKALALNKPMWLLIVSQILDSIRQVCYSGLAYFYLETLDAFYLATTVSLISATLSYIGILAVPFISKWLTARDIVMYGYLWTGLLYVLFLILGYDSLVVVYLIIGFAGMPNGAMSSARKILLADSTDYMEYMTWKKYGTPIRSEAMVWACNSTATRISGLWKSALLPAGLWIINYVSARAFGTSTISVVQTPDTLKGIFYMITIAAIAGNLLPAFVMAFDDFTGKKKEKIMKELTEMREQKMKEYEAAHASKA